MGLYSRFIFPRLMDRALSAPVVTQCRLQALGGAAGRLLEVGFGSGLNLAAYPISVNSIVGLDATKMLPERVAKRIASAQCPVQLELRDASSPLPFPSYHFDTVVTTFTLCSIENPSAALTEIRRVLSPQGCYLFLEHGRSDTARTARWQDWISPIQRILGSGCRVNRRIDDLIASAGLCIVELTRFTMPGVPRVLGEMYLGRATAQ